MFCDHRGFSKISEPRLKWIELEDPGNVKVFYDGPCSETVRNVTQHQIYLKKIEISIFPVILKCFKII